MHSCTPTRSPPTRSSVHWRTRRTTATWARHGRSLMRCTPRTPTTARRRCRRCAACASPTGCSCCVRPRATGASRRGACWRCCSCTRRRRPARRSWRGHSGACRTTSASSWRTRALRTRVRWTASSRAATWSVRCASGARVCGAALCRTRRSSRRCARRTCARGMRRGRCARSHGGATRGSWWAQESKDGCGSVGRPTTRRRKRSAQGVCVRAAGSGAARRAGGSGSLWKRVRKGGPQPGHGKSGPHPKRVPPSGPLRTVVRCGPHPKRVLPSGPHPRPLSRSLPRPLPRPPPRPLPRPPPRFLPEPPL